MTRDEQKHQIVFTRPVEKKINRRAYVLDGGIFIFQITDVGVFKARPSFKKVCNAPRVGVRVLQIIQTTLWNL